MKKFLLSVCLLVSSFINAQENWVNIENNGFNYGAYFGVVQTFQGKIYVAGDTMAGILLYSSPTGNAGSFVQETGLNPVLQITKETNLSSSVSNANYMFLGSQTNYDTIGGATGVTPQVYRFNGTNYVKHGIINYGTLPLNNQLSLGYKANINKMALYSPTGSNDTVYSFTSTGTAKNVSVWKASATAINPTWVNSTNFSAGSGITKVYDAQVWHKKLYVAVNSLSNGGMILRTSDGANWDTVVTALSKQSTLGFNYFNENFTAFEIFNDTLIAGLSNSQYALWYTTDSLLTTQTWKTLLDSTHTAGITNSWSNVSDLQIGNGKLWIEVSMQSTFSPEVFIYYRNTKNIDTLLRTSSPTGLESVTNSGQDARMVYFNNSIYSCSHTMMPFRRSNPNGSRFSGNTATGTGFKAIIWRFTTINPVASFVDSVTTGTGYCQFNTIYLASTSTNATTCNWYVNGSFFATGCNVTYNPNGGGVNLIKMISYNGTNQSIYKDSTFKTITIYWNPVIDSVKATSYTVCQGQADTMKTYVSGAARPFTYSWYNAQDFITYPSDSVSLITLYVCPSPSPYVYMSVSVKDANLCSANGPNTLFIYVNPSDSLSGRINDTLLNPVSAGKVYLFKLNPLNPNPGDTAGVFNLNVTGKYNFLGLYYGSYIAKAVADTSNALYKTAVGTYFSNKTYPFQWDSAIVIQHHSCVNGNNGGNNIKILQLPGITPGPGTITGDVTAGPGYGMRITNPNSVLGAPLKGVDVKLGKNPGGSPAARTTTDNTGHYTFSGVALGSYKIYVDIPNFGMDSVRAVNLTSVANASVHNDYYVDSNMVRVVPTYSATTAICAGDSIKLQGVYQKMAGVYYDTLTAAGGYDSLIVTNLSIKPLPTVTVTANTFTVCSGSNAILSAGGTTSYLWSTNAGSVTTATASVNPITNTTYTITGTTNGCSDKKTISINTLALPSVTASASLDSVCSGGSVTLVGGGATTYTWSNGVTNWVPFVPGTTNTYTVSGTGANACVNTATVTVVVKTCIGIRQIAAAGLINVYPIPATNNLFIEVEKNARIRMYDITGQLVLEQSISIGKNEINIGNLPAGAYDLMLNANGQNTYVKVMINK